MRTVTAAEQSVLNSAHFATFARILVEDADGTYRDLTNQDSLDWVQSGRIAQTIDQIVATGDFTFWRKQEGGNSLAPLDRNSSLNRDAMAAYAPLIDVGRGIRCEFATVAIGSSPAGGDWKRVFDGVIDRYQVENDFVNVIARDAIGAEIADRWIETETDYGTGPGRAIEDVMQDILTQWTSSLTLYTPTSPSFLVTTYTQQRSSVMDALQQLAALVGWVVQPRWDDGTSAFRLAFYEPERAPVATEWTWAANRYEAVPYFSLDRLHIRNALSLWYTDTGGVRSQVAASDATSIAKYGRQFMEIEEASDSPIDTAAEAQAMIDSALLDLKDPIAGQEIKTFCFWPAQLSDYHQFNANDVHYSANQAFGITGFRHEFSAGHVDTFIRTRGKPAGFIRPWIARGNVAAPASSGVTTFHQASAPSAEQIGDLWFDTDDANKLYRWSGSQWVEVRDSAIAQAIADAATAQAAADGKIVTFYQASAPVADGVGDLWFDTDDATLYRWNGTDWAQDVGDITSRHTSGNTHSCDNTAAGEVLRIAETTSVSADLFSPAGERGVTYARAYESTPEILLRGFNIATFSPALGTAEEQSTMVEFVDPTPSGVTVRARNRTYAGTSVAGGNDFPARNNLNGIGRSIKCNLGNVPAGGADNDRYTVHYSVSLTSGEEDVEDGEGSSIFVTVAIESNDGGGWLERARFAYSASSYPSGEAQTRVWPHEQKTIIVSNMGTNDDIRLVIKGASFLGAPGHRYSIHGFNELTDTNATPGVTYRAPSAGTERSAMTQNGHYVSFVTVEKR